MGVDDRSADFRVTEWGVHVKMDVIRGGSVERAG